MFEHLGPGDTVHVLSHTRLLEGVVKTVHKTHGRIRVIAGDSLDAWFDPVDGWKYVGDSWMRYSRDVRLILPGDVERVMGIVSKLVLLRLENEKLQKQIDDNRAEAEKLKEQL